MKKVLIAVAVVIAILLVVIATRPDTFHIERSATIAAPAQLVFDKVNDFHQWQAWSPWAKLDPTQKTTYDGPPAGVGASSAWEGNKEVGKGRMTITDSAPPSKIVIKLEFLEPMTATETTTFTFNSDGQGTKVTWAMDGHNNFFAKAMSLAMDMDKMVGPDFERGLASIKTLAEADAKKQADDAAAAAAAAAAAPDAAAADAGTTGAVAP